MDNQAIFQHFTHKTMQFSQQASLTLKPRQQLAPDTWSTRPFYLISLFDWIDNSHIVWQK